MMNERWPDLLPEEIRRATGSVYHYTDPAGLLGLVESHELWATEATGMNDLSEVRQGWEFIRNWLSNEPVNSITDILRTACEDDHPASDVEGVFICSASTNSDDANQWRLYGGAGRGYAVEIRADDQLVAMSRANERSKKSASGAARTPRFRTAGETVSVSPWLHVLYTEDEKRAALAGLVARATADWQSQEGGFGSFEEYDEASQWLSDEVMTDLAMTAQLMKSQGFAGESEVRVIVATFFDECSRFRATPSGVVRYVRLTGAPAGHRDGVIVYEGELGKGKFVPVQSVWIGPLINAQNNQKTVNALLGRNRLPQLPVFHSRVPLRG
jgi:hypothetical protein